MRRLDLLLSGLLLGGLLVGVAWLAPVPETVQGVPRVVDGDTLEVGGRRLRLSGLDAPEMAQVCEVAGSPYRCGLVAREALRALVGRGDLSCAIGGRDRWGRDLATCTAGGLDIGASLVRRGLAVSYGRYLAEEREARRSGIGLWAGRFDRPDAWRRAHARAAEPAAGAAPTAGR